jgi:hypothetical protein
MAITRLSTSSLKTLNKYDDMLAGNSPYIPSSFYNIATVTAAGGETSLSFTSIPSTYKSLQIRGIARDTGGGYGNFYLSYNFNNDSANHYAHTLYGSNNGGSPSVTATYVAAGGNAVAAAGGEMGGSYATTFSASILDVQDYTSTSKNKTVRIFAGGTTNDVNTGIVSLNSGAYISLSAITSIKILPGSTAFAAGTTFALYGVN